MSHLPALLSLAFAAGCLAGCATPALVLDSSHPASPEAPEVSAKPMAPSLRADAATRRTRELLLQREAQAAAAENPSPMPPTHSGHEAQ